MTNDITPLATPGDDGQPQTTSLIVAEGTGNQHKNVLELVRNNIADFEEFGRVAFQTRPRPEGQHGGGNVVIALLNEAQATLLLTYMRNSDVVRQFNFRPIPVHEAPRFRGEVMHTLKVTPQGAEAIARLVAKEKAA